MRPSFTFWSTCWSIAPATGTRTTFWSLYTNKHHWPQNFWHQSWWKAEHLSNSTERWIGSRYWSFCAAVTCCTKHGSRVQSWSDFFYKSSGRVTTGEPPKHMRNFSQNWKIKYQFSSRSSNNLAPSFTEVKTSIRRYGTSKRGWPTEIRSNGSRASLLTSSSYQRSSSRRLQRSSKAGAKVCTRVQTPKKAD